jgi:hypothetical protein
MAAKKTSVYLIGRTLAVTGQGKSLSGRLNQIVARYEELIRLAMPDFGRSEWLAIFESCRWSIMDPYDDDDLGNQIALIWASIAGSRRVAKKWHIDALGLSERIDALADIQKIAVIEAIQKFWEHGEKSVDEALAIALRTAPGHVMADGPITEGDNHD